MYKLGDVFSMIDFKSKYYWQVVQSPTDFILEFRMECLSFYNKCNFLA